MSINLEAAAHRVLTHGPDRVMIGPGEATTWLRAFRDHGIVPDIVFIRNDGWTLGAPGHLEAEAYELWQNEWVGFMRRPEVDAMPISAYRPQ